MSLSFAAFHLEAALPDDRERLQSPAAYPVALRFKRRVAGHEVNIRSAGLRTRAGPSVEHGRGEHRGADVVVAAPFPDGADVVAVLWRAGREGMA